MLYLGLAAGLCVLDFVVKYGINHKKSPSKIKCNYIEVIPLYNKGAAMGLFNNHKRILNIVTIIAVTSLSVCFAVALKTGTIIEKVGYALVNAGAWNNAYERIVRGKVTDYINFPKFPGKIKDIVFNLSDFFIMIGAFLLIIMEFKKRK